MLKSMTGFARRENQNEDVTCRVEIRSVNNRFIDVNTRLPKALAALELPLKKLIKSRCARGSFDISVALERSGEEGMDFEVKPNLALAEQYLNAFNQIREHLGLSGEIDINAVLSPRDVVKPELREVDSSCEEVILSTVEQALTELIHMREAEGVNLEKDILQQIDGITKLKEIIKPRKSLAIREYQNKLKEKIRLLTEGAEIDETRIAQETAILADRCDVSEEVIRLESHLEQFHKLVANNEPQGRKLEFLTQEINRETNTIGSKTIDLEVSRSVIEIKSHLEKIREQLANIE
ncbi:MAG: YicC/YloC family endoribonuclease [SAR324 cluster bacterium]|nr:YicC/YloC family endoribonuclease [SAR324 cluster bacterium]